MRKTDNILIISSEAEMRREFASYFNSEKESLNKILSKKQNRNIIVRHSEESALKILENSELCLIICDNQLEDISGLEFVKNLKTADVFYSSTPTMLVGRKENGINDCIAAFDVGADDFIAFPFDEDEFLARGTRLLRWFHTQRDNPIKLASTVSPEELTSILQLLETEKSTGTLKANYRNEKATINFIEGLISTAKTEYCQGKDVLTEILCWPFAQIKFTEFAADIDAVKHGAGLSATQVNTFNPKKAINVSQTMMDCVLEVDEYKEVLGKYPDFEISFSHGLASLPTDSNRIAKQVLTLANNGLTLEEILDSVKANKRHLILLIDQMIRQHYIDPSSSFFNTHLLDTQSQLRNNRKSIIRHLSNIQGDLKHFPRPVPKLNKVQEEGIDPLASSKLTIFIAGDNEGDCKQIFDHISNISALCSNRRSIAKSKFQGEFHRQLFFSSDEINLVKLAPKLTQNYIKELSDRFPDAVGILFFSSALNAKSCRESRRRLRYIIDRFKIPIHALLKQSEEEDLFEIDCEQCTNVLSVSASQVGAEGACPICQHPIYVPRCLDYMKERMRLSEETPCTAIDPDDSDSVLETLHLFIHDILDSI